MAASGTQRPTAPARMTHPRIDVLQANSLAVPSPVNQNGSFEFDRVIKAGPVLKRTRKTKQWKPIHLVLRPNVLSIYKDKDETRLRHQIALADLTAVARQKDTKKKKENVFGLFSPARNYHLSASTEGDAEEWVDLIRTAARIDEEDDEMILLSPSGTKSFFSGFGKLAPRENVGSSSSEAEPAFRSAAVTSPENIPPGRRASHALQYSGNEHGSFSDFSDTGGGLQARFQRSSVSLHRPSQQQNVSQMSNLNTLPDDERVIYHGWLYVLKSKGGVRQWKKVWVVLRPKALGLYKNDDEYAANMIIPFSSIIDAVEIDPASRSKKFCMQIISDEKNFRFCAADEDSLAKWLGAFKSLLVKRREAELHRVHPSTIGTPLPTIPQQIGGVIPSPLNPAITPSA
ncbi:PH domain-like protein [Sporormia fimetaria CBS 119925]|uniref:PH domain-like protein n=1 Tax=Sporormia fimetaria CBS 119925 TaxID=1340428 RepID=A0A6A6V1Q5_9PLEO|nr:PH domain-like protein [Sporormia fimetaria CBS 119925]